MCEKGGDGHDERDNEQEQTRDVDIGSNSGADPV